jgi:hypothetical protein
MRLHRHLLVWASHLRDLSVPLQGAYNLPELVHLADVEPLSAQI